MKKNPLNFEDLKDFIECYKPENRSKRKETWSEKKPDGRWRKYSYKDLIARDKCNLDILWLKDDSVTDLDNLPSPSEIADEIVTGLKAATERFSKVMTELGKP